MTGPQNEQEREKENLRRERARTKGGKADASGRRPQAPGGEQNEGAVRGDVDGGNIGTPAGTRLAPADPQPGERNQAGERGRQDAQGTRAIGISAEDARLGQAASRRGTTAADQPRPHRR